MALIAENATIPDRPTSTWSTDHLEPQSKRRKLAPSATEAIDLDPIQSSMRVIDLENEATSNRRAAESSKLGKGHHKIRQPEMFNHESHQLDLGSNVPGGFHAGDYMTEEQLNTWLLQSHNNDALIPHPRCPRSRTSTRPTPAKGPPRNGPVVAPFVLLESYKHSGSNLRPNVSVELKSGEFMKIIHIIQDTSTSAVSLRGLIFQRTREMNGVLKKALNEVCWVLHVDEDDGREESVQAMGEVPVSHVIKRRAIKMTNQPFPALSFRTDHMNETYEAVSENGVLVCRWKYTCYYKNAAAREKNTYLERVVERIRMGESDNNCAVQDEQLRYDWRGDTIKGGASSQNTGSVRLVSPELRDPKPSPSASDSRTVIDPKPLTATKESRNRPRQRDGKGRFSPVRHNETSESAPARRKKPAENPRPHQMHPQKQVPCDVFNSLINVADDSDSDVGMNFCTASDPHAMRLQTRQKSPEVIEVAVYHKTTSNRGIIEQEYKGKITSWPVHSAPSHWSKQQRVDGPTATRSRNLSDGGATSKRRSRTSSPDSDRTVGRRSPSVEFLGDALKLVVPSCPNFQSSQRTSTQASSAVIPNHRYTNGDADLSRASGAVIRGQKYTYGDAFCGAGGMSRGALMAGLEVRWGFDSDEWACKSYALNFPFPDTSVYCLRADQFVCLQAEDHKVDVLHSSPPCQFFSPAHTINGKDDDDNIASLFGVYENLKKTRPRVVTLEQTAGITNSHPHYLNAVVLMFTEHGFSVRYKICYLEEYGLPQTRPRLIIIASW